MADIKGLTISIGADTKEFNKGIKTMDKAINNTNKQVNELAKSLEVEFDSGRFAEAQKLAQKAITQTEEKANALRKQLEYLDSVGKGGTENYQKLQTDLVIAESKAVLLKDKLEQIKSLKINELADKFKEVGEGISEVGKKLMPVSAIAAGLLTSFAAIGKSSISAASDIDDMAQQVSLSGESLQKWRYIAMQTGLDNQTLQNAFVKTQASIADLATSSGGPGAEALKKLGLSMEQASLGLEGNIDLIINNLMAIKNPLEQAALANEIFGDKLGSKVIPLLNAGGEGLATLTAEFESLGYMSNEQIETLSNFDDKLNVIKYQLTNVKNEIGAALLPVMESLAGFMTNTVVPAIQQLSNWFGGLSDNQLKTIVATIGVIAAMAPVLMIIGKISSGIGSLISGVGGLSDVLTFLSAHPIIAIIGAVTALIGLLYAQNETFRESINGLISQLGDALMPILQVLMDAFGAIFKALMPIVNIFGNVLGTAIKALTPIIMVLVDLLSKTLVPVIKFVANIFVKAFGFVEKVIEGIIKFIESIINGVIDFINFLIRQINKLGDFLGFTIKELKRVELSASVKQEVDNKQEQTEFTTEQVIAETKVESSPQTVINNDYSDRDIKIEVVVQNYGENVDVDELTRQINIKLAEAM